MAVRVSDPGAVDDHEEKWAQAVYWNELIDKIDELPDAATFIQTFSMAVVARGKSRAYSPVLSLRGPGSYAGPVFLCRRCMLPL